MRFLVLSDLHSNLEALQAALAAARRFGYDRVLVLGDLVGYGADPNAVLDILRGQPGLLAIRGNHDRVAASVGEGEGFNDAALLAVEWTRRELTPDNRAFLAALPKGPVEFASGKILCHGTPLDEDEYLLEEDEAGICFDALSFEIGFFGHSHYPGSFALARGKISWHPAPGDESTVPIRPRHRYLINPGSVGQPRDRNPRGGFAIYDDVSKEVSMYRVAYPASEARDKILRAGLPRWLGDRLLVGA